MFIFTEKIKKKKKKTHTHTHTQKKKKKKNIMHCFGLSNSRKLRNTLVVEKKYFTSIQIWGTLLEVLFILSFFI